MSVKVFLLFFSLLSIPGVGATRYIPVEEVSDSVRVFRFVPCRATFYVHFGSNDVELDSILSMAKRYQGVSCCSWIVIVHLFQLMKKI